MGSKNSQTTPATSSTAPAHQTTGLRERGNDTSRSTGPSGRKNVATRRNMRREERVTVQGPVKKLQPDGMSHRGGGGRTIPIPVWGHAPFTESLEFIQNVPSEVRTGPGWGRCGRQHRGIGEDWHTGRDRAHTGGCRKRR